MYKWLLASVMMGLVIFGCSSQEPCDCPEDFDSPEPDLSVAVSSDPCNCGPSNVPRYDYWLFTNACDTHDMIQMESIRAQLDSCFQKVNQNMQQDVLASCYKIKQLCREAEYLMKQRLQCVGESRERMNQLKAAFSNCQTPACVSLYRILANRERKIMLECVDYYVNESNKRWATIDSLWAQFPGKISSYENQAKDCINAAKRAINEKGIKCVERLELNIIIDD